MTIESNRIKTSLFLTLLMILTPFAAASTVTTFSDGSTEVVIEFKDGVNTENTTDGGFYIPSGETITSASVDIVSTPMLYSTSNGVKGVNSFSWDPNQNNGATTISNPGKFTFSNTCFFHVDNPPLNTFTFFGLSLSKFKDLIVFGRLSLKIPK